MTSSYMPLVASSAVSMGDLAMVHLGSLRPVVASWETPVPEELMPKAWKALVQEMSGAHGASLGATSVEVDGVGP
jgi:hypothetical protein